MKKTIKQLTNNIYFLEGEKGCNIYLLDFKKKCLIDSGHPDEIEYIYTIFKENGFDLSLLSYLINTHSHGDHVGGNFFLKKINPSLKIIAHKNQPLFLKMKNDISLLIETDIYFENYVVDYFVDNEDSINLGEVSLKVLSTPGHTSDSISLLLENKNILFSGDLIYKNVITQLNFYQNLYQSLTELKNSCNLLHKLLPITLCPGHGDKIKLTIEILTSLFRKIKKLEQNSESLLITTLIPSVEFYVLKNQGINKTDLIHYFYKNMIKFSEQLNEMNIKEDNYINIIEKMISLMKFLNIIKDENNFIYTINKANYYLTLN